MIDVVADSRKKVERAMLVGVRLPDDEHSQIIEHLDELSELVASCDIGTVDRVIVPIRDIQVKYYMGSGKAEEVVELAAKVNADCLIFDTPLTPSQQRNWEKLAKICVIDREEVILDIFAKRASTREAVLQVELAQLEYSLPRLTRAWTHLSRQRGGVTGARGEGETQIENDRRMLRRRIMLLTEELKEVRKHRSTARKSRERGPLTTAAIVGYTNVGKSSLLKALSGAEVLIEDKLFATLDPTTRKVKLKNNIEILLTDTVGFVRKLPHNLVEAFKSTLEEAVFADFLILVLDVGSLHLEEHWETTLEVLKELGADEKDIMVVFNKIDKVDLEAEEFRLARYRALFPGAIFCSTLTGEGLDELESELVRRAGSKRRVLQAVLPPSRFDLRSLAASSGIILAEEYDDNGNIILDFSIGESLMHKFNGFLR